MKVPYRTIDRRARESRETRDECDPSSPQLFGIEGDDEVSLPLIEMGEQRGVFLLQFFFLAHTGSISGGSPIVTIIFLRALIRNRPRRSPSNTPPRPSPAGGSSRLFCNTFADADSRSDWVRSRS